MSVLDKHVKPRRRRRGEAHRSEMPRLGIGRVPYGGFPDCGGVEPEHFQPGETPED